MAKRMAFIGGTGPEGLGLAVRFAHAGNEVVIGSRRQERADEAAQKVREKVPNARVRGMENRAAVQAAEIVFVTVPFDGQADTLASLKDALAGKLVIDTVVPLKFEKGRGFSTVPVAEGSAAEQAKAILDGARVVGAFQNLSAHELMEVDHEIPADVVVCGDDREARQAVIELAKEIRGCRGIDGGALYNARYVEDITALLLNINRTYKSQSMIKIVGV